MAQSSKFTGTRAFSSSRITFRRCSAGSRSRRWAHASHDFPYHYGLINAAAADAVQNKQIRFERLRLVLRNGLEIDVPGNTDLAPLELGKAFDTATAAVDGEHWRSGLVRLARQQPRAPVRALDGRAKRIYRISEVQQVDENTGLNPQPVQVRRIKHAPALRHR